MGGEKEQQPRFDAFISYSRRDGDFCARLQRALEDYRPPSDLGLPPRNLAVFRDASDLTGSEYYRSIDRSLDASAKLIVICSPAARESAYVDDEIARWRRGPEHIVPVLVDGLPNNEVAPGEASMAAFPPALVSALRMPLAINYLGFDTGAHRPDRAPYQDAWFSLLSSLYGIPRMIIEERDRKRALRRRRLLRGITISVIAALSVMLMAALWQRNEAVEQRNRAVARQVAVEAANLQSRLGALERSVLLAVESIRIHHTPAGEAALRAGLALMPRQLWRLSVPETPYRVAVSGNGTYLAFVDRAGAVRVHEPGGEDPLIVVERKTVDGYNEPVVGLRFGPGGERLVIAYRGHLRVLSLPGGNEVAAIFPPDGDREAFTTIAIGRDGRMLAAGTRAALDGGLREGTGRVGLWTFPDGKPVDAFEVARSPHTLAVDSDAGLVALAGERGPPEIWRADGTQVAVALPRDPDEGSEEWEKARVEHLELSPDGIYLAAAIDGPGEGSLIKMIETASGKVAMQMRDRQPIEALGFDLDGRHLHTVGDATVLRLYQAGGTVRSRPAWVTAKPLPALIPRSVALSQIDVSAAALSPDGFVAAVAEGGAIRVWDLPRPTRLELARMHHEDVVHAVAFSSDDRYLATGSSDHTARVWDPRFGTELARVHHDGPVGAVAFAASGKRLATASIRAYITGAGGGTRSLEASDRTVRLWDLVTGEEIVRLALPEEVVRARFDATGGRVAVAHEDDSVTVWDVEGARRLARFENESRVTDLDLSPGGDLLAFAVESKALLDDGEPVPIVVHEVILADPEAGTVSRRLDVKADSKFAMSAPVGHLRFSPDGRLLVASGDDLRSHLWAMPSGSARSTLTHAPADRPEHSPIGRMLSELGLLRSDRSTVYRSTLDHTGRLLASASGDGIATIREVDSGRILSQIQHAWPLSTAVFSPGGRYLATAGFEPKRAGGNAASVWLARPEDLIQEACALVRDNLSTREWAIYFPDRPHQATCANRPLVGVERRQWLF